MLTIQELIASLVQLVVKCIKQQKMPIGQQYFVDNDKILLTGDNGIFMNIVLGEFRIIIDLGERIRKVRTDANVTQEEFAKWAGVHVNTVRRWEKDRGYPDALALCKICARFRTSLYWLVLNEGPMMERELGIVRRGEKPLFRELSEDEWNDWQRRKHQLEEELNYTKRLLEKAISTSNKAMMLAMQAVAGSDNPNNKTLKEAMNALSKEIFDSDLTTEDDRMALDPPTRTTQLVTQVRPGDSDAK